MALLLKENHSILESKEEDEDDDVNLRDFVIQKNLHKTTKEKEAAEKKAAGKKKKGKKGQNKEEEAKGSQDQKKSKKQ